MWEPEIARHVSPHSSLVVKWPSTLALCTRILFNPCLAISSQLKWGVWFYTGFQRAQGKVEKPHLQLVRRSPHNVVLRGASPCDLADTFYFHMI